MILKLLIIVLINYNVPLYNQLNTKPYGDMACIPTSTSMVLNYWRQFGYESLSPQELVDINIEQKQFGKGGMWIDGVYDELEDLGYKYKLIGYVKITQIQKYLNKGPILAALQNTITHIVVITGANKEYIFYNDPLDGKKHKITYIELNKKWLGWILIIYPKEIINHKILRIRG